MLMASKTVTRAELSEAVYRKVGLSRAESAELVEQVLGEISDRLAAEEDVKTLRLRQAHRSQQG
jgi:integration host factor subunit alpha